MTNFPSVVLACARHSKHPEKSKPETKKYELNIKVTKKKNVNSSSNTVRGETKEGEKSKKWKKIETGKEGKWSIINFRMRLLGS